MIIAYGTVNCKDVHGLKITEKKLRKPAYSLGIHDVIDTEPIAVDLEAPLEGVDPFDDADHAQFFIAVKHPEHDLPLLIAGSAYASFDSYDLIGIESRACLEPEIHVHIVHLRIIIREHEFVNQYEYCYKFSLYTLLFLLVFMTKVVV
jgi:hypothetical protein